MATKKQHDLHDFMHQINTEMETEYQRIQRRALDDPGTAGDEGEENWATLLRDWLPSTYEVVTKGRILGQDGTASRQVDLLVLKGAYPKKLLNKKHYLAAGVAAAFECKVTLKASHIVDAMKTCSAIKDLYPPRYGTPYRELRSPIVYGVLAHSHAWKSEGSTPEDNIEKKLREADAQHVTHPRQQPDLVCVADLAAWVSSTLTFIGPSQFEDWTPFISAYGPNGCATTSYIGHTRKDDRQTTQFTPVGVLISHLSQKLAWEDPSLRGLADYYRLVNIAGSGKGQQRRWNTSIYSEQIRARVEAGALSNQPWDEWQLTFL